MLCYAAHMAKREEPYEKMLLTLPQSLVKQIEEYTAITGSRNKSAFVAEAVRAYIKPIDRRRQQAEKLLRQKGLTDREIERLFSLLDQVRS